MHRQALTFAFALVPGMALAQDAPPKVDFQKQIAPILIQRCIECHGPKVDKGDLRLDQRAFLFPKDAEDEWTAVPGKPDDSELVHRITLPAGDDDIMPNKGEPLTKEQQELFKRWIAEGADWPEAGDKAIADALAAMVVPKITFELPPLDAARQQAIAAAMAALEQKGAVVQRVAADTEAIDVNLSLLRDKIGDADLALLAPLADRLVWLNLSRTAVGDAGMAHVGKLVQLRKLQLANTKVGNAGIRELAKLQQLASINLYGTAVTDDALPHLDVLKGLKKVYAWQTGITKGGVDAIHDHFAKFEVDLGDYADERMAAAQQEIAARDAKNKPVNDSCPVTGKPVDAAQTVEFEGRRIAFCCEKCKAAFAKDPAKYADKLPPVDAKGDAAPVAVNTVCPVSGKPVDPAQFCDHEGRRIAFCCEKCKAAFAQDPAKYADKLPPK